MDPMKEGFPTEMSKEPGAVTKHVESLSQDDHIAMNKAITRKFDRRVLPFCILMHLCSMIDRANIGNAKVLGLVQDLRLTGNQFNIALSVFYATYIAFEIPANMIMKKIGPKAWLSFLTFGFGIVTMCQGFVHSFEGMVAVRIFLGLCEAGVLPGIMYTLASFYRRHELTTRMGYLSAVVSLSGAFGGLLATGFSRIPSFGILHTWRHVFFFEGLITAIIGLSVLFLPNSVATSSFLTEEERAYACTRLIDEAKALPDEKISKVTFKRAIFHAPTQAIALSLICSLCCMGSLHIFTPTLLRNMGYSGQQAQLMSVPPYVLGAIVCITTATLSDRLRKRGLFLMGLAVAIFVGFTLNHFVTNVAVCYFGIFLAVSGGFAASPLLLSWSVDNNSGPAVKAIAAATVISIGGFGQLLSTWTYRDKEKPRYPTGHSINMACAVVLFASAAFHSWWAIRENKKREAVPYPDHDIDESQGLGHDHPLFRFTP